MIRLKKISTITTLLFVVIAAGCGFAADNKEAREIGSKFYDALKAGDAATAVTYCATDETMTPAAWQDLFERNLKMLGNVTDYNSGKGFHVSKSNGVSTVRLGYDIAYTDGSSFDSLILQNDGKGFKIYKYAPSIKTAKFKDELSRAKEIVTAYFNALTAREYDKALGYVGYSGIEKHSRDEWMNFFDYIDRNAGVINSFTIDENATSVFINDEHEESGVGNIYAIAVVSQHPKGSASNEIDVFQPKYGDELKIIAHNIE